MKTISLLAGAALLGFASAPAVAQSASPTAPDNNFKCWDAAKNEVRNRLAGTPNLPSTTGSGGSMSTRPSITGSGASTTGSGATTGSGSPANDAMASPGVTNPGSSRDLSGPGAGSRPAEAAGLPIC